MEEIKKIKARSNEKVIEIKGLYKSFGENHVLRGVDLDVYKGENVVVLGRSGTGKSVLIKILVGLLKPDAGTIKILDMNVDKISPRELNNLRLKVGFSFQNSALYDSMTVRENLEFPLVRNTKHYFLSAILPHHQTRLLRLSFSETYFAGRQV